MTRSGLPTLCLVSTASTGSAMATIVLQVRTQAWSNKIVDGTPLYNIFSTCLLSTSSFTSRVFHDVPLICLGRVTFRMSKYHFCQLLITAGSSRVFLVLLCRGVAEVMIAFVRWSQVFSDFLDTVPKSVENCVVVDSRGLLGVWSA